MNGSVLEVSQGSRALASAPRGAEAWGQKAAHGPYVTVHLRILGMGSGVAL